MKVVVGIGNPGPRYRQTRHNLGMRVVERLADEEGIALARRRFQARVGQGQIEGRRVLLVKPLSYVNLTGQVVAPLARWHRCRPEDILVVCDDMNLEVGRLRLRRKGSSGGHNGLASIIEALGTEEFPRLRIGIGRGDDPVGHVLGRLEPHEEPVVEAALDRAAEAVRRWVSMGIEAAMNEFNR